MPTFAELNRRGRLALPLLAAATALFIWWGWKQGAYFESVLYPGAILVFAVVAVLALAAPLSGRIAGPAGLALAALAGLAGWTFASALWSTTPATAIADGERVALYAAVFGIGIWTANLLGRRMLLSLVPLAVAGAAVGVVTTLVLAFGTDADWYLHADATLRFPIGYRNANAAFFMICLWPLLVLATESRWDWRARALLVGSATVLIELTVLAQSRGSLPAVLAALLAYLAFSPHRLRAGAIALLAALPALPALPTLLDVYQHTSTVGVVPLLHDAAQAVILTGLLSVALAGAALRAVYPKLELGAEGVRRLSWVAAGLAIAVALVAGGLFVASKGGPVDFVDQRVSEFERNESADLRGQGVRFGANVSSRRQDFWRVSLEQAAERPLAGGGGGSFRLAYLRERDSPESPEDPHSLEMLVLSELGLVGLALLACFLAAACLAVLRARVLGPAAAAVGAAALASGTQWFLQASYDWFWHYPGVTAPALFLLGAAAAPRLFDPTTSPGRPPRLAAAGVAAALALVCLPLFLAERYIDRAQRNWRADPDAALADLDRAAGLNPLDHEAPLLEGVVASEAGDRDRALDAFVEAIDREPENYAGYWFAGRELLPEEPGGAAAALALAEQRNPQGPEVARLQRRLEGLDAP
jgi:hypothetical protein